MKKLAAILLCIVIISSLCVSAQTVPTFTVSNVVAERGQTVSVPVTIENNPGFCSFTIGVEYDESVLEFVGFTYDDTDLPGMFTAAKQIVWLNNADTSVNGNAFCMEFKVLDNAADGKTDIGLTYKAGDIVNYYEEEINFAVVEGGITVYTKGDVDCDGDADADDLVNLRKMLLMLLPFSDNADVNLDGAKDVKDLVALKNIL